MNEGLGELKCRRRFVLTEEAFLQFCNFTAAAGAFAHHLTGRSEQVLGSLDDLISSHQVSQHGADPVQKLLRGKLPALDLAQAVLPLGSQKR